MSSPWAQKVRKLVNLPTQRYEAEVTITVFGSKFKHFLYCYAHTEEKAKELMEKKIHTEVTTKIKSIQPI